MSRMNISVKKWDGIVGVLKEVSPAARVPAAARRSVFVSVRWSRGSASVEDCDGVRVSAAPREGVSMASKLVKSDSAIFER